MNAPAPGPLERARALLADEDETRRVRGVHLLRDEAAPGAAAELLVATLADPGSYVPHAARAALQTLGAGALPAVLVGLGAADAVVRTGCAWALALPQADASNAVCTALAERSGDAERSVREAVAGALGRIGGAAAPRIALLASLLGDVEERVRLAAARSAGVDPALAEGLRERLLEALDDGKATVREAVAVALAALPPDPIAVGRVREAHDEEPVGAARMALASLLERWQARA